MPHRFVWQHQLSEVRHLTIAAVPGRPLLQAELGKQAAECLANLRTRIQVHRDPLFLFVRPLYILDVNGYYLSTTNSRKRRNIFWQWGLAKLTVRGYYVGGGGAVPKSEPTGFAARLQIAREKAGLGQKELGDRAGIDQYTVAKLEQGVQEPTWPTVLAIADALGLDGVDLAFYLPKRLRLRTKPVNRGRGRPRKA